MDQVDNHDDDHDYDHDYDDDYDDHDYDHDYDSDDDEQEEDEEDYDGVPISLFLVCVVIFMKEGQRKDFTQGVKRIGSITYFDSMLENICHIGQVTNTNQYRVLSCII